MNYPWQSHFMLILIFRSEGDIVVDPLLDSSKQMYSSSSLVLITFFVLADPYWEHPHITIGQTPFARFLIAGFWKTFVQKEHVITLQESIQYPVKHLEWKGF